jgi:hypothetical protein
MDFMNAERPKVLFRGESMVEGWPQKIIDAQAISVCEVHGNEVSRIRYGREKVDWGANVRSCRDCGVIKDEFHVEGCDVEECPGCGGQRFNCECESDAESEDE